MLTLQSVAGKAGARLYLAFSAKIAPERVARWQQAVLDSYCDGTMCRLYQNSYREVMIQQLEQLAATGGQ